MSGVARQLLSAARDAMIAGDYKRARYLCDQAIEHDPDLPDAHAMLADWRDGYVLDGIVKAHDASQRGERDEALRIFDELLAHDPRNADVSYSKALFLGVPGLAELETVANRVVHDTASLIVRAWALETLMRLDEAEQAWTQVIEQAPDMGQALVGRAHVRLDLFRANEALQDIHQALRLDPESAEALAALARACLCLGEFERALEHAARARKAGFEDTRLDTIEAESLCRLHRYSVAEARFKRAAEEDALYYSDWVLYAYTLIRLQRHSEAVAMLEARVDPEMRYSEWYSTMAEALLAAGDADGRPHLDTALQFEHASVESGDPLATYNLAWCHAHRAAMASAFDLSDIDIEAERLRAAELLAQAVQEDPVNLRYARAAVEFSIMWDRADMPLKNSEKNSAS